MRLILPIARSSSIPNSARCVRTSSFVSGLRSMPLCIALSFSSKLRTIFITNSSFFISDVTGSQSVSSSFLPARRHS